MGNIQLVLIFVLVFYHSLSATELKQLENGNYFVTGKGCGILNTIQYLDKMPQNLAQNQCSVIVKNKEKVEEDFVEKMNLKK